MNILQIKANPYCEEKHFSDYQVITREAIQWAYMKSWLKGKDDEIIARAIKSEAFVRVRHDDGVIYEMMLYMGDDLPTMHTNKTDMMQILLNMIHRYWNEVDNGRN